MEIQPSDPPPRPLRQARIIALMDQMGTMDQSTQADEFVSMLREALTLTDRGTDPLQWGMLRERLGESLQSCRGNNRAAQLEEARVCFNDTLDAFDSSHAMPRVMAELGLARTCAETALGTPGAEAEQSLVHYERAMAGCTGDVPAYLAQQVSAELIVALMNRQTGSRAENIDLALGYATTLAHGCSRTDTPDEWASAQYLLARVYDKRVQGEPSENMEQAIALAAAALGALESEAQAATRADVSQFLGTLYLKRTQGDASENNDKAFGCFLDALRIWKRSTFPLPWARAQNNLGTAWVERLKGDYAENVEQAIRCHEGALVVLARESFPLDWAATEFKLGNAFVARAQGLPSENLTTAIAHYRAALEVRRPENGPEEWASVQMNLAGALWNQAVAERKAGHPAPVSAAGLDEAMRSLEAVQGVFTPAADPSRWAQAEASLALLQIEKMRAGDPGAAGQADQHFRHALGVFTVPRFPADRRRVLANWGDLFFETERWAEAASCYDEAVGIGEGFLKSATTPAGRLEMVFKLGRHYSPLAYALLRAGHPSEALLRLEQGKTRLFSDQACGGVAEILAIVPPGGALVVPLVTSAGGAVYVVPHGTQEIGESQVLRLDSLTEKALADLVQGASPGELGGWLAAYTFRSINPSGWRDALESGTRTLWDLLMGPVCRRLGELQMDVGAPVLILPESRLGLLPLHAAWREEAGVRRYFLDDYTVLNAPSSHTLGEARRGLPLAASAHRLLAVVNPTGNLPAAELEGANVAKCFAETTVLAGPSATTEALKAAAPGHTCLHFACHGYHDWKTVLNSGLEMAGSQVLTLGEILGELHLAGTRLVMLSACETGMPRVTSNRNEFLGLPAGFLHAGAAGVVGSLWAVEDLSTALLVTRFYRAFCAEGLDVPQALRQAQLWARDLTAREAAAWLVDQDGKNALPENWGRDYAALPSDAKPFQHPLYWAAFKFDGTWQ